MSKLLLALAFLVLASCSSTRDKASVPHARPECTDARIASLESAAAELDSRLTAAVEAGKATDWPDGAAEMAAEAARQVVLANIELEDIRRSCVGSSFVPNNSFKPTPLRGAA